MLQNPSGKGSAYLFNRKLIKEVLNHLYYKLPEVKRGKAGIIDNNLWLHIKVPSMGLAMFYDVILKIDMSKEANIYDCPMQVYSNSPHFQFTYTYVFNEQGSLIPEFVPKCFKKSITDAPTQRNPVEAVGFEKSIVFAIMYLRKMNVLNKDTLVRITKDNKISISDIFKDTMGASDKLNEYNILKNDAKLKAYKEQIKKPVATWTPEVTKKVIPTRPVKNNGKTSKLSKTAKTSKVTRTDKIAKTK